MRKIIGEKRKNYRLDFLSGVLLKPREFYKGI